MYKTFTQNDLIRFLYNEMTSEESLLLQDALINDLDLCAAYYELKSSIDLLIILSLNSIAIKGSF